MPQGRGFCCNLKIECILSGMLSGILSVVWVIINTLILLLTYAFPPPDVEKNDVFLGYTYPWLNFWLELAHLSLAILLCFGAVMRNVTMCRIWLFGNPILITVKYIAVILLFVIVNPKPVQIWLIRPAAVVIFTLIAIWSFLVVNNFIKEIQRGPDPQVQLLVPENVQLLSPFQGGQGEVVQYGGQGYGGYPQQLQTPSQDQQMNQVQYAPPPATEMAT